MIVNTFALIAILRNEPEAPALTFSIMMSDTANGDVNGRGKAPVEENCPPEAAIHWSQTT